MAVRWAIDTSGEGHGICGTYELVPSIEYRPHSFWSARDNVVCRHSARRRTNPECSTKQCAAGAIKVHLPPRFAAIYEIVRWQAVTPGGTK
jgi:hypothetical protein